MWLGYGRGQPRPVPARVCRIRRTSRIHVVGDSNTELRAWHLSLKNQCDVAFGSSGDGTKPAWTVHAASGNQTTDIAAAPDTWINDYDPTHLLHAMGLNDWHTNQSAPHVQITPAQSLVNMGVYFDSALAHNPTLVGIGVGACIFGGERPVGSNACDDELDAGNAAQQAFFDELGWPYADTRRAFFVERPTLAWQTISDDGVHFRGSTDTVGAGGQFVCSVVEPFIIWDTDS